MTQLREEMEDLHNKTVTLPPVPVHAAPVRQPDENELVAVGATQNKQLEQEQQTQLDQQQQWHKYEQQKQHHRHLNEQTSYSNNRNNTRHVHFSDGLDAAQVQGFLQQLAQNTHGSVPSQVGSVEDTSDTSAQIVSSLPLSGLPLSTITTTTTTTTTNNWGDEGDFASLHNLVQSKDKNYTTTSPPQGKEKESQEQQQHTVIGSTNRRTSDKTVKAEVTEKQQRIREEYEQKLKEFEEKLRLKQQQQQQLQQQQQDISAGHMTSQKGMIGSVFGKSKSMQSGVYKKHQRQRGGLEVPEEGEEVQRESAADTSDIELNGSSSVVGDNMMSSSSGNMKYEFQDDAEGAMMMEELAREIADTMS